MKMTFEEWLNKNYTKRKTITNYISEWKRIEEHHGAIADYMKSGSIKSLIAIFNYTAEDEIMNRPDPTGFGIKGNLRENVNTYKSVINRYIEYYISQQSQK